MWYLLLNNFSLGLDLQEQEITTYDASADFTNAHTRSYMLLPGLMPQAL